jgi:hypothetical protein
VWAAPVPNEARGVVKIPGFVKLRFGKPFFDFSKKSLPRLYGTGAIVIGLKKRKLHI